MVAAAAGTSTPTVSKVLRGGTDVSTATRQRVMDAVHHIGYAKRPSASLDRSGLGPGSPPLIDLIVNHVNGSWANGVLTGVEAAASEADIDVVITLARDGRDWVSRLLRRPSSGAVIVLVDPSQSQLGTLESAGIPVVLVDPMSRPASNVPSLGVTNWDGGRSAAQHLRELGHVDVGIIGGNRAHLYGRARIDGFCSEFDGTGGRSVRIGYADWDRTAAREEAHLMLSDPAQRPTAIFACSDVIALGVYDAARDLGIDIPAGLSVVGFDDVPEALWASPPITTVRQPIADMGAEAVRLLLRTRARSHRDEPQSQRIELSTSLIVRESSGPPRYS